MRNLEAEREELEGEREEVEAALGDLEERLVESVMRRSLEDEFKAEGPSGEGKTGRKEGESVLKAEREKLENARKEVEALRMELARRPPTPRSIPKPNSARRITSSNASERKSRRRSRKMTPSASTSPASTPIPNSFYPASIAN